MTDKEKRAHDIAMVFITDMLSHLETESRANEFSYYTSDSHDDDPHAIDVYKAIYNRALSEL